MREAHVADWRLEVYGGVGHSFTNPDIASRGLPGLFAYDEPRRQALVGVDTPARRVFLTPSRLNERKGSGWGD